MIAALAPIFPLDAERPRAQSVLAAASHVRVLVRAAPAVLARRARRSTSASCPASGSSHALEAGRATAMVGVPALWQLLERRVRAQVDARGPIVEGGVRLRVELESQARSRRSASTPGKLLFAPVHDGARRLAAHASSPAAPRSRRRRKSSSWVSASARRRLRPDRSRAGAHRRRGPRRRRAAVTSASRSPASRSRSTTPDESGVGEVLARGPERDGGLHRRRSHAARDRRKMAGSTRAISASSTRGAAADRRSHQGRHRHGDAARTSTRTTSSARSARSTASSELAVVGIASPKGGERVACLAVAEARLALAGRRRATTASPRSRRSARRSRRCRTTAAARRAPLRRAAAAHGDAQGEAQGGAGHPRAPRPRDLDAGRRVGGPRPRAHRDRRGLGGETRARSPRTLPSKAISASTRSCLTELLEALEARGRLVDQRRSKRATASRTSSASGATPTRSSRTKSSSSSSSKIEGRERSETKLELPPQIQEAAKGLIGKLQDAFYGQMMKPTVYGRAFIPHNRNVIVVANHASPPRHGLRATRAREVRRGHRLSRGVGLLLRPRHQARLLRELHEPQGDRSQGRRARSRCVRRQTIIEEGKTVLVFPEGTRSAGRARFRSSSR